jgi:hypothetical protein
MSIEGSYFKKRVLRPGAEQLMHARSELRAPLAH